MEGYEKQKENSLLPLPRQFFETGLQNTKEARMYAREGLGPSKRKTCLLNPRASQSLQKS